ncbi:hypothetical protein AVEN_33287-1 [Araneus ventricosus]|nr:hypothetical protein AVEN_33287-1 [Araneus ventricosus]
MQSAKESSPLRSTYANGEAGNLMGWREANLRWSKLHQCPTLTLAALLEIFPKVRLPFPEYIAHQPVHDCYQGSLLLAASSRWPNRTAG